MDRILQGVASTIQVELTRDGTPEDPAPDSATVQIVRWSDGTTVYSGAAIDIDVPPGVFAHTLSPTDTALLDRFTATWTFTFDSFVQTVQTVVEVVGGFLFTIADARANPALTNTTTYPTASIVAMRTTVEDALEHACSRAFVPRYTRETFSGTGTTTVVLSRPDVRSIRSVTVAGTAYTAGDLANVAFSPSGELYSPLGWTVGASNIVVGYEHGMPYTPPEVSRAAITLAKMWLVGQRNPIDDRAITFNTTDGGTYSLAVPGRNGSVFGQPDVDAVIGRYDMTVGIA
jgi:hypothetical protein